MTPLLSSALLASQSDERLAALAAAGHDRAFEAIVERYRRPLGRYLRRVLSAALAEDVLQATFVNAWRSLGRGTEVRDLRPWLYRIAHNQAVNALSRAEPRIAFDADASAVATADGPEDHVEQRDLLARALTAISGLPERQRAALVAVAVADRPHPDVAAELGLSEGALRQLVHRARTTLRAAATAVVPGPIVTAAASAGHDATVVRVAELAAGAGGAGLTIKAGTGLLAAGALIVGSPAAVDHDAPHRVAHPHRVIARVVTTRVAPASASAPAAVPRVTARRSVPTAAGTRRPRPSTAARREDGRRSPGSPEGRESPAASGSSGPGPSDTSEHSGRSGSPDRSGSSASDDNPTTTSPGTTTTTTDGGGGTSGSGRGTGGDGGGGSGTSGGGDDVVTTATTPALVEPAATDDHSGRGAETSSGPGG